MSQGAGGLHPEGAHLVARGLGHGVQDCGCDRAGGVYTAVAQDAKMGAGSIAPTANPLRLSSFRRKF